VVAGNRIFKDQVSESVMIEIFRGLRKERLAMGQLSHDGIDLRDSQPGAQIESGAGNIDAMEKARPDKRIDAWAKQSDRRYSVTGADLV
jgi:hypothetical protein